MSSSLRRVAAACGPSMSNTADQSGLRTKRAGWLVVSDMTINDFPPEATAKTV